MNRFTLLWLFACFSYPFSVAGESVYKSVDKNGDTVFSDAPVEQGSLQRQSYKSFKGRETATASCKGATSELLDQRFKKIEKFVIEAAEMNQLDPDLIKAVAQVESCFDTAAVSRAGASGVMQLMPKTATSLGVTSVFDAQQNILGGSRYLAQMLNKFDNDLDVTLAAYNAGPGAVARFGGIPPFPETTNYIKRVKQLYQNRNGMNRTAVRKL